MPFVHQHRKNLSKLIDKWCRGFQKIRIYPFFLLFVSWNSLVWIYCIILHMNSSSVGQIIWNFESFDQHYPILRRICDLRRSRFYWNPLIHGSIRFQCFLDEEKKIVLYIISPIWVNYRTRNLLFWVFDETLRSAIRQTNTQTDKKITFKMICSINSVFGR